MTARLPRMLTAQKFAVLPAPVATMLPLQRFDALQLSLASAIHVPLAVVVVTAMVTRAKALWPAASLTRTVK